MLIVSLPHLVPLDCAYPYSATDANLEIAFHVAEVYADQGVTYEASITMVGPTPDVHGYRSKNVRMV